MTQIGHVVELDLDGDGTFETDITQYVMSVESFTGRDRASQLTGKAGPGRLNVVVDNQDNRFSDFNVSSPYYGQLHPGVRIRWRDEDADANDPVVLAQDRFNRTAGALGTSENSLTWDALGSAIDPFEILDQRAVPSLEGDVNLSLVTLGSAEYYVQATITQLGNGANIVGLVTRYDDDNDYSLLVVNVANESLDLVQVDSGVQSVVVGIGLEVYSGMTIGALVADSGGNTTITAYLEGVPLSLSMSLTAEAGDDNVGLYAEWETGADQPSIDDFFAWDHLPSEVEGIFWTGRLTEPRPTVSAGPYKTAALEAVGPLADLARQAVTPPTSAQGKQTGFLIGNVLAQAGYLRPPGPLEAGDVTTGIFVNERWSYAINVARLIEETELGFLFETQEGFIGFRSRSHNDALTTPLVSFTDA